MVCGPPGSGKTSYVLRNKHASDLIVDLDALHVALTGCDMYDKPSGILSYAITARDAVLARLRMEDMRRPGAITGAWIISCSPDRASRDEARRLYKAHVIVLETSAHECIRRISHDERRKASWKLWEPMVWKWWDTYQRDERDEVIRA
jgi:predicted kinase